MTKEQLEGLGLTVHAELADKKLDDYFFVVEDKTGNMDVLYFYDLPPGKPTLLRVG